MINKQFLSILLSLGFLFCLSLIKEVILQQPDPQSFWLKPVAIGSDNHYPLKDVTGIDFANLLGGIGGGKRK
ncbi:Homeobox domain-containing protein [Meloidogyne graminicola]|uniref:Homeobox domain-containing protein n=1 Tax=Meloidogyne graminicola TaxID=189291 RepID=A0A8S9ZRZ2_9BILA|nr:Homeobox domain-containing protein [Meloidogyne graminicola]